MIMNLTKKEKLALVVAGVYLVIMITGMLAMTNVFHISYGGYQMTSVLVYFTFAAVCSAIFFYRKYFRGTAFKKPRINMWIIEFMLVTVLIAGCHLFYGEFAGKDITIIATICATMLLAGIGEELVFRGIILNTFKEKRGIWVAILWSSVIFGILHITNIFGGQGVIETLKQVFSAGLAGVLFAWVYLKTNNVIPTMIYHGFYDMFILLSLYVPVSLTFPVSDSESLSITQIIASGQQIFSLTASVILLGIVIYKIYKEKKSGTKDLQMEI